MRIIGGYARGIRLSAPNGLEVRPTEDRVKETIFSILGDLTGKTVVDVFAGTGALGLEALSRGAARVKAIEINPQHGEYILRNYAAVSKAMKDNLSPNAFELIRSDASQLDRLLHGLRGQVDLVLADPPYHPPEGAFGAAELLVRPAWKELAADNCLLVLEHADRTPLPWSPKSPWQLIKTKTFGIRAVSFAKLPPTEP